MQQPVRLERSEQGWLLANGLVRAELGEAGVHQIWGADGRPQLSGPLAFCRWGDHGEFWDAWDIAAHYRDHPLPLHWQAEPELAEQGPLCTRLVWRGCCGRSALRLDVQLRAASPWLELTLRVDWRQRHELLRLEVPLAAPACRYAADTPAGVLERPAAARTAREQARWEVPALSWMAAQNRADGGLALLLDGPQGVSATPEQLGVSLLRAPTWPDPSADQATHRLRLALMPCAQGWRQQAVPRQAQRFREPLWIRPAAHPRPAAAGFGALQGHNWGSDALQLVRLEPLSSGPGARLTLQNLSPQRQRLCCPPGWLAEPEQSDVLGPWQLGSWLLRVAEAADQSS